MAFSFLVANIAVCRTAPARRPLRAGWPEKNHPRSAPVFFSAKPCRDAGKRLQGYQEIKMPVTQAGIYKP